MSEKKSAETLEEKIARVMAGLSTGPSSTSLTSQKSYRSESPSSSGPSPPVFIKRNSVKFSKPPQVPTGEDKDDYSQSTSPSVSNLESEGNDKIETQTKVETVAEKIERLTSSKNLAREKSVIERTSQSPSPSLLSMLSENQETSALPEKLERFTSVKSLNVSQSPPPAPSPAPQQSTISTVQQTQLQQEPSKTTEKNPSQEHNSNSVALAVEKVERITSPKTLASPLRSQSPALPTSPPTVQQDNSTKDSERIQSPENSTITQAEEKNETLAKVDSLMEKIGKMASTKSILKEQQESAEARLQSRSPAPQVVSEDINTKVAESQISKPADDNTVDNSSDAAQVDELSAALGIQNDTIESIRPSFTENSRIQTPPPPQFSSPPPEESNNLDIDSVYTQDRSVLDGDAYSLNTQTPPVVSKKQLDFKPTMLEEPTPIVPSQPKTVRSVSRDRNHQARNNATNSEFSTRTDDSVKGSLLKSKSQNQSSFRKDNSANSNITATSQFSPQHRRMPNVDAALTAMGYQQTPHHDKRHNDQQAWTMLRRLSDYSKIDPKTSAVNNTITVAVRIRPFTLSEIQSDPRRIVSVNGNKLVLVNPNAFDADPDTIAAAAAAVSLENMRCNDWAKVFCYDHCFWSYDPFDTGDTYVDQAGIYDILGRNICDMVLSGTSVSCFAYGATTTGKSHTMFGSSEIFADDPNADSLPRDRFIDPSSYTNTTLVPHAGLAPRVLAELLQMINNDPELSADTKITLSFVEIYQERLRDCLNSAGDNELKIREHPSIGTYIENLTKKELSSVSEALHLLYQGYVERTAGSKTGRNSFSSKSHGVVTIELSPRNSLDPSDILSSKKPHKGVSAYQNPTIPKPDFVRLHMVDLAGSEREFSVNRTDDSKNTEKLELKMIRRSLSTLGYIIKALGQGAKSKGLPFRDSSLTWLLKDAICGRHHAITIATISPAHTSYDETLSTLKYAERLCMIGSASKPGHENMGKVSFGDTVNLDLSLTLANDYSRLKRELGGNSPGTPAARQLLHQTLADPQQRLAKLTPYKPPSLDSLRFSTSSIGRIPDEKGNQGPDLKEAYRQLHGKFIELQIELDNARTDRDSLQIQYQDLKQSMTDMNVLKFSSTTSVVSDLNQTLKVTEQEVSELRGIIVRKEESIDKLLNELAEERNARATIEKTARAQVTELISRLEALHRQGQIALKEGQKWQEEAERLQLENEQKDKDMSELKESTHEVLQECEGKIRDLENEICLLMDQISTMGKERDRVNAEMTVVLKEKADMAAREVLLTSRIQQLQQELEQTKNESKLRSELEILKLQRDSLYDIIKQQEQALQVQQQQSEASLKMLHQRQAALDRLEQKTQNGDDEMAIFQNSLQQLLAREGQSMHLELIDAKKLTSVIASAREKIQEAAYLREELELSREEKSKLEELNDKILKEVDDLRISLSEAMERLQHYKKVAVDWETRSNYWQKLVHRTTGDSHDFGDAVHRIDSVDHEGNLSSSSLKSAEYLELRSENCTLREQLKTARGEAHEAKSHLDKSASEMQKEFVSLWNAIDHLNKMDESKDLALAELRNERDKAIEQRIELEKQLKKIQVEYENLQGELQAIDLDLLDAADTEGILIGNLTAKALYHNNLNKSNSSPIHHHSQQKRDKPLPMRQKLEDYVSDDKSDQESGLERQIQELSFLLERDSAKHKTYKSKKLQH